MININNHIGTITISEKFILDLVEQTVTSCFGVIGVCRKNSFYETFENLTGIISDRQRGIQIYKTKKGSLIINLHIKVSFGTNISAITDSISHKVSYAIKESTGINVETINVLVDKMDD